MGLGPIFDKSDPIWKNTSDPVEAQATYMHRHNKWLAEQHPEVARLYCEHGQYVAKDGILSHLCQLGCEDRQRGPKAIEEREKNGNH